MARQFLYDLKNMPCVDMHVHIKTRKDYVKCVRAMDAWGGVLSINLSGTKNSYKDLKFIREKLNNQVLVAPGVYKPDKGLWWSTKDLSEFKKLGYAGIKIYVGNKYIHDTPELDKKLTRQTAVGLPLIGLHIANPPQKGTKYYHPDHMKFVKDAEKVIARHPKLTFIMAHGFWLMNGDAHLKLLGRFFDKYPNLNADLCAPSQYWFSGKPNYNDLRKFIIKYKDRLLFGTDGPEAAAQFIWEREKLETGRPDTRGFFGRETTRGLALPLDVLNHIYYWNAARLIPRVKERLIELGYQIGDKPPVMPKGPQWLGMTNGKWDAVNVYPVATVTGYHLEVVCPPKLCGKKGKVVVLDAKGREIRSIYKGKFDDVSIYTWNGRDRKGKMAAPGHYKVRFAAGKKKFEKDLFVPK